MRTNQLQAQKHLLEPDLLICDSLNHTTWNEESVCFARNHLGSATNGYDERKRKFTYDQSKHESPYWHLRMPPFNGKNS